MLYKVLQECNVRETSRNICLILRFMWCALSS